MTNPQTTKLPTAAQHAKALKDAIKIAKTAKGNLICSKVGEEKYALCITNLTKENIAWIIIFLQKELMKL